MSRLAKAAFLGSIVFTVGTIYTVHYMQWQESDTMYQSVLRDDERRKEKMRQRAEDLAESQRKRALYESVQHVSSHSSDAPSRAEGS